MDLPYLHCAPGDRGSPRRSRRPIHQLYEIPVPPYAYSRCVNDWGFKLMQWRWIDDLFDMRPYLWDLAEATGLMTDDNIILN